MIHMLSRFNLNPDQNIEYFQVVYSRFCDAMKKTGLLETTGVIGKRINDTPMDTDHDNAQMYYVILSFQDRLQLDAAYDHLKTLMKNGDNVHQGIPAMICNSVFTCWQDID